MNSPGSDLFAFERAALAISFGSFDTFGSTEAFLFASSFTTPIAAKPSVVNEVCGGSLSMSPIGPWSALPMRQNGLRNSQMRSALVKQARRWLDELTEDEKRCPGDYLEAMRRLSLHLRVSFSTFWALRYRPPKGIDAADLLILFEAHEAMCDRTVQRIADRRAATDETTLVGSALTRLARAIAGELPLPQERNDA